MIKHNLLDTSIDEINKVLKKEYLKLSDTLLNYLMDIYITILGEDGKPLKSHLYSYNRYYEMLNKIQQELSKLGVKENRIFDDRLVDLYKKNSEIIGKQFNLGSNLRTNDILSIVKTDWVGDGSNYSDRIWNDKRKLAQTLQEELIECVGTGSSPDKMKKRLMERFNVSYHNADRLARTECQRVYIRSTLDKYIQAGVEKVKIIETIDDRTCETCRSRNNKVLNISTVTETDIISHPQCRATIVAVID